MQLHDPDSEQEPESSAQVNRLDLFSPAVADHHVLAWISALGFDQTALVRATIDTALDVLAGHLSSSPIPAAAARSQSSPAEAPLDPNWSETTSDLIQSLDSVSSLPFLPCATAASAASLAQVVLRRQCTIDPASLLQHALDPSLRPRLVILLRDDWPLCRQLLDVLATTAYHAFARFTGIVTVDNHSEAIIREVVDAWGAICNDLRGLDGQFQRWDSESSAEGNIVQHCVLSDKQHSSIVTLATWVGDAPVDRESVSRLLSLWFLLVTSPVQVVQQAARQLIVPAPTPQLVDMSLDTVAFALRPLDPLSRRLHRARLQASLKRNEQCDPNIVAELTKLFAMVPTEKKYSLK